VALVVIVERAKKCLDFVATLFVLHIVLCSLYSGFPTQLWWWLSLFGSALVMTLLGEYLCMRHEMREIRLSATRGPSIV